MNLKETYVYPENKCFVIKDIITLLEEYQVVNVRGLVFYKSELPYLKKFNDLLFLSRQINVKNKLKEIKKNGKRLGRPKGVANKETIKSKYAEQMIYLHNKGLNYLKIASKLNVSRVSVAKFFQSLKKEIVNEKDN